MHKMKIHKCYSVIQFGQMMLKKFRLGRETTTTIKFDIDQLVGDMAITPGRLLNCHFVNLTIQWPRNSVDAMSNMFGKTKHRLGIILKFQIKK